MSTAVRERPILFSGPMVRALLEGRKTQTRRVAAHPCLDFMGGGGRHGPEWDDPRCWGWEDEYGIMHMLDPALGDEQACHPFNVGERLWVRETWCEMRPGDIHFGQKYSYRATTDADGERCREELGYKWRPSIFMPRAASRIQLDVVARRVERLQRIEQAEAVLEGSESVASFRMLWDEINAKRGYGWDVDPFVFVYTFSVVTGVRYE